MTHFTSLYLTFLFSNMVTGKSSLSHVLICSYSVYSTGGGVDCSHTWKAEQLILLLLFVSRGRRPWCWRVSCSPSWQRGSLGLNSMVFSLRAGWSSMSLWVNMLLFICIWARQNNRNTLCSSWLIESLGSAWPVNLILSTYSSIKKHNNNLTSLLCPVMWSEFSEET